GHAGPCAARPGRLAAARRGGRLTQGRGHREGELRLVRRLQLQDGAGQLEALQGEEGEPFGRRHVEGPAARADVQPTPAVGKRAGGRPASGADGSTSGREAQQGVRQGSDRVGHARRCCPLVGKSVSLGRAGGSPSVCRGQRPAAPFGALIRLGPVARDAWRARGPRPPGRKYYSGSTRSSTASRTWPWR